MANYGCGSITEKDKDQVNRERNPEKSCSDNIYNEKDKRLEEGLPMEDSPYLQYKDLEYYKKKGYGTQGRHLEPKPGRGAGGPYYSFRWLHHSEAETTVATTATETINRQGVP